MSPFSRFFSNKGEATPPVMKNVKREPEDDDLENKGNLKKQKIDENNDEKEQIQTLYDRLLRIEAIVNLLVSSKEADHQKVLISPNDQNVPAKNSQGKDNSEDEKAAPVISTSTATSSSDEDSDDDSDENIPTKNSTVKAKAETSSSSDGESDDWSKIRNKDERKSRPLRYGFGGGPRSLYAGGRFGGGRCGGYGFCGDC